VLRIEFSEDVSNSKKVPFEEGSRSYHWFSSGGGPFPTVDYSICQKLINSFFGK